MRMEIYAYLCVHLYEINEYQVSPISGESPFSTFLNMEINGAHAAHCPNGRVGGWTFDCHVRKNLLGVS